MINSKIDKGCIEWGNDNACIKCSYRWALNTQKTCQPVSDLCYTWNQDGTCDSCYGGYIKDNGNCVINPTPFKPTINSLCQKWKDTTCL